MSFQYSPPAHTQLDILYEDGDILVVNKPAGLLSVPGRGPEKQDCQISRVHMTHPSALIVHRLDMATSGILLLALNKSIHRQLSALFAQRHVKKHYVALVHGRLMDESGRIDKPMRCDWPNRPKQIIDLAQGKSALTDYRVEEYYHTDDISRLLLKPLTGRTHQLRLHCQSIGHSIVGDALYGTETVTGACDRLCLHASMIEFQHPVSLERITIFSEVPF